MTNTIEEQRFYLKKLITKNNLTDIKRYIKENNVKLSALNDDHFDVLIYAIENESEVSLETIQYIIDEGSYSTLNYYKKNEEEEEEEERRGEGERTGRHEFSPSKSYGYYKTPLFSAIAFEKFNLANLLLKNKADINYTITDFKSIIGVALNTINILSDLSSRNFLNSRNLKYILNHGFKIKGITAAIINDLIQYKNGLKNDLLEIIFRHYIFDNNFILNFLHFYKYQQALSNRRLHYFITKEKNKIVIQDTMYASTIQNAYYKNWDAIYLFFVYDGSEPSKIIHRIRQYHILDIAIIKNDYYLVKAILNFIKWKSNKDIEEIEGLLMKAIQRENLDMLKLLFDFFFHHAILDMNNLNFERILIEVHQKQNVDIMILLMETLSSINGQTPQKTLIGFREMIILADYYHYISKKVKDEQVLFRVKQLYKKLSSQSQFSVSHYNSIENVLFMASFYGNENSVKRLKNLLNSEENIDIGKGFKKYLDDHENDHPSLHHHKKEMIKVVIESIIKNTLKTIDQFSSPIAQQWIAPYLTFLLNTSIQIGHLNLVQSILENEKLKALININSQSNQSDSKENPLVTAYTQNNVELFDLVLKHRVLFGVTKNKVGMPLILKDSLQNRKYKMIKTILKYPVQLSEDDIILNKSSPLPLIKAIYHGDLDAVQSVVTGKRNHYSIDDNYSSSIRIDSTKCLFTPLILSYLLGAKAIFQFLVKYADINELDTYGYSLLHYAILKEDADTVQYLMGQGVDINYKENSNKYGHSAIDISLGIGDKGMFFTLLQSQNTLFNIPNKEGDLPLSTIIKSPDFTIDDKKEIMEGLIKRGSYINLIDINTPLKDAVQEKSIPLVEVLLNHGANINFTFKKNGYSPLVYAVETQYLPMVKFLVEKGADINYVLLRKYNEEDEDQKENVLLRAVKSGNLTIFKYLLEQDAIIHFDNKNENNQLVETIDKSGKTEIFEYLVQQYSSQFSSSIIESIIYHNQYNLLKILKDKQYNINTVDENGDTPLSYAIKFSNEYLADHLIHWGANPLNINHKRESIYDLSYKYSRRLRGQNIYKKIKIVNKI